MSFIAGLLVALVIAYCYIQRQQKTNQYSPSEPKQPAPMYEDVSMDARRDIELKENVAYRVVGLLPDLLPAHNQGYTVSDS